MQHPTVQDVMTNQVLTVPVHAGPDEVIAELTGHDVSALAVVDEFDVVLGVLTRTDVLKVLAGSPDRWRRTTARQLMTAPAVTVGPDVPLARAGRVMHLAGVNRLLVTGRGRRLLGLVSAGDLLKVFGRADEAVRADVAAAVRPVGGIRAGVRGGVVLLTGRVTGPATPDLLADLARAVPGVTEVVTDLHVEAVPARREDQEPGGPGRAELDGWWLHRENGRQYA